MKTSFLFISCLVLFVFFSWCRFYDLKADLPSYFDSGISITDEGAYLDAPKKMTQMGSWNLAEDWWHSQKLAPLYSYLMVNWFDIFDVSLKSGRLFSVCLGVVTLMMVVLIGFRLYGIRGSITLLTFVGSSYTLTHFHRAAMVESLQLLFIWLIILLMTYREAVWREAFLGMVVVACLLTKLSALFALSGFLVWYVFQMVIKKKVTTALSFLMGFCFPLILVEFQFPGFLKESLEYSQQNFGGLFNITGFFWHFLHVTVRGMYVSREAPVMILFLIGIFYWRIQKDQKYLYLWAGIGGLLATCFVDLAIRRYLLFMPWFYMIALNGFSFTPDSQNSVRHSRKKSWVIKLVKLVGIFYVFSGVPMILGHFGIIAIKYWVLVGLLSMIVWLSFPKFFVTFPISKELKRWLLIFSLLLFCLQQGRWFFKRTHYTDQAIGQLASFSEHHPEAKVLYGNIAPTLSLDSKISSFFLNDRMGDPRAWKFPDTIHVMTYTKPQIGYEDGFVKELFELYPRKYLIFERPFFSEAHISRSVGLWCLSRN